MGRHLLREEYIEDADIAAGMGGHEARAAHPPQGHREGRAHTRAQVMAWSDDAPESNVRVPVDCIARRASVTFVHIDDDPPAELADPAAMERLEARHRCG